MSEIFSWLRQGNGANVRRMAGARAARVESQKAAVRSDPQKPPETSAHSEAVVPRAEIRSVIQFDLKAADYRVKNVLDPLSLVGEQFRRLRASLSLLQKQRGIRILLVTSASPGEGKTFAACSLAGVLAQEPERKVLLIDADLRRPQAGKHLGIKGAPGSVTGLVEILQGQGLLIDSIAGCIDEDLFFLPSGKIPSNPSELLTSPTLESTLKTARSLFDWVVVDSPPVLALSDASVMAPACDAVLFVVQAGVTPSKRVQDAVRRLGREKICGIVMNRVKHLRSSSYYYHYYHHKVRA